ncbi:MAG: glycoside hydrolase family 10 protein [Huintestinicola sp.]
MKRLGFVKLICVLAVLSAACGCTAISEEIPDSSDFLTEAQSTMSEPTEAIGTYSETKASTDVISSVGTETSPESYVIVNGADADMSSISEEMTSVSDTFSSSETSSSADSETTTAAPETTAPRETTTAAFESSAEETQQITVITLPVTETSAESTAATTVISTDSPETSVPPMDTLPPETSYSEQLTGYYPVNSYYTLNFSTQKAVWISFLEYERIMRGHTEEEFTELLNECMDNISSLGCNTVYFQVRAYGDAYYDSELFPAGDRLAGKIGGTAAYDPLEIAVKSAHDRGLSIHAWVNPMRLMTDSQLSSLSSDYILKQWYDDSSKRGTYIVKTGDRWYLNPAYSDTTALICSGISEIISRYNVDGIQIDDYFYPTKDTYFDSAAYAASGTELSLAEWRRSIISEMVRAMYRTVHTANPTAVFGISPQGNYSNNYNDLYADVKTWCSTSGYCDYICPQIYFGFENGTLPFAPAVDEWQSYVSGSSVQLVIGLAAYKSGCEDSYAGEGRNEWKTYTDILQRQREYSLGRGAGYAFFRYDSLFSPDSSAAAAVNAELNNLKTEI